MARPLARLLATAMAASPGTVLVPVPSQRAAVRRRGQDHALRLARRAASLCDGSIVEALRWTRAVADQGALDLRGRQSNVAGAMSSVAPGRSRQVWVVDDIVTTGATIDESVRALTAGGWSVLGVAVVASVDIRSERSQPATGHGPALRSNP